MKPPLFIISWIALLAVTVDGQTPQDALSFDAASVKPAAPNGRGSDMPFLKGPAEETMRFRGGPGSKDPGRIDYVGVTLKMLLKRAYDVPAYQISGPGWLDTERYDIAAKLQPGTNRDQLRSMLRELLVDRFQIELHRETKTLVVYSLTVAKNGPKLQPPENLSEYKAAAQKRNWDKIKARFAARERGEHVPGSSLHMASTTMERFAETLSSNLDRPVKDKTQLAGAYSFWLEWDPDGAKPAEDTLLGPSIFAAVQEQLGLRLQRDNELFELLVIDKAQKTPISN